MDVTAMEYESMTYVHYELAIVGIKHNYNKKYQ